MLGALSEKYAPISLGFGVLKCDASVAAAAFVRWQSPIHSVRGVSLQSRVITGSASARLDRLLPLTSVEPRRFLFTPSRDGSTIFFDNGHLGTDAFSVISYLAETLNCMGIRVLDVPDVVSDRARPVHTHFGATILEVYSPTSEECQFLNVRRSVSLANDGGRWRFDQAGHPFDFEDQKAYQSVRVRDRFSSGLLREYLKNLGIDVMAADFLDESADGFLISKRGSAAPGLKEFPLPSDAKR